MTSLYKGKKLRSFLKLMCMLIVFTTCCLVSLYADITPVFYPSGELGWRINWVQNRFDYGQEPAYTDEFILQDVRLAPEYPRRFQEFSGDISGRFIEALSVEYRSEAHKAWICRLVKEVLKCQKSDGRFGNADLVFTRDQVGREHMALLWGNGRLLVGLTTYYMLNPDPEVLQATQRMGDFFIRISEECAQMEVIKRLENQGANGFICFTQWNEGLELLSRISGDPKYRELAIKLEPLLPPPPPQHTHGYLTTLRGDMLIWETTKNPEILARVERRYQELQEGGWFQLNGGVAEYFNKTYPRDEGCSEADLVRLCIQLWRATGKEVYLEHAEKCLFNSLFPNQFETGDFGHHTFDSRGYVSSPGPGRAWWCCSMHGLRALHDVRKVVIDMTNQKNIRVNLFLSGEISYGDTEIRTSRVGLPDGRFDYIMRFVSTPETDITLSIRHPSWAEKVDITINGKLEVESDSRKGYIDISRVWNVGDEVRITITPDIKIINEQYNNITLADLKEPKKVAIFIGPWLMGISAYTNPMFHGEPYMDNVLLLPEDISQLKSAIEFSDERAHPLISGPRLTIPYIHSGFPTPCKVTLTPISERSQTAETTFTFWHLAKTSQ